MHRVLWFTGFILCGCEPAPQDSKSDTVPTTNALEQPAPKTLHTDAFAVSLIKEIGMKDEDDGGYRVADDEVQTLQSLFQKFGIDREHLGECNGGRFNNARWIRWRLSPSYEIYIDITDFDETAKLPMNDPNRQIYTLTVRRIERE